MSADLVSITEFCSLHIMFCLCLLKGTNVFSRKNPPPLYKKSQTGPFRPRLEKEHYLYILEECTHNTPQGNMEVILATDVEGML